VDAWNLAELRGKTGTTQATIAHALGVSLRSVSAWESAGEPKQFSPIQARGIQELFMPKLLDEPLMKMTEEAFLVLPSEISAVWLVWEDDCMLLPSGVRRHDFHTGGRSEVSSPRCVSPMRVDSLTTWPLKAGEIVNLAGSGILAHPAKKHRENRAALHFRGGVCESILHVPAFAPSPKGPRPVLLLSLENKLDLDGEDVLVAGEEAEPLYSDEEVDCAERLAQAFRDRLLPDLCLLGMSA
jgi:hypothetical protein